MIRLLLRFYLRDQPPEFGTHLVRWGVCSIELLFIWATKTYRVVYVDDFLRVTFRHDAQFSYDCWAYHGLA
jgi:hypothetical protein